MLFEFYFARRISWPRQKAISSLVVRLALISIALAVATMEISLSVVQGFETAIEAKVTGFASHIEVGNYYQSIEVLEKPVPRNDPEIQDLKNLPNVRSVDPFVIYPGLCRAPGQQLTVYLKGVTQEYDWEFFESSLEEGRLPDFTIEKEALEVLISKKQARLLDVELNDRISIFFVRDSIPKRRRVSICGIYESGMEEIDSYYMMCDIRMLQRIRNWGENDVSGFEVRLSDTESVCELAWLPENTTSSFPLQYVCNDQIQEATDLVNISTPFQYGAESIQTRYPQIFDWLGQQHQTVSVILILMMIVAIINMSSVVLILIIERTQTIGILQALGMSSGRIRKMFVYNAMLLILIGMLLGNILGLGLLFTQDQFEWLKLDQESYFIKTAPVAWVWGRFLLVNIGTLIICTLFMLIPTVIITKINPVKAIRFD